MSLLFLAASLAILLLVVPSSPEKAPYTSFAKDATSAPESIYYDYIVIGGGTAGCALAATLSASSKVLVLERGGLPYDTPNVKKSTAALALLNLSKTSPTQSFITGDGVYGHRGRVLGGSSVINMGFYSRASDQEVSEHGWDPQLVGESYEWVENKLVFEPKVQEWHAAVKDGLLEAGLSTYNGFTYAHVTGTKVGGSTFDDDGYRHSAADLLEYADPINISVLLQATVHKILFKTAPGEKPKAHGVLFKDSNGAPHTAYLNCSESTNEIILAAGALGSPQLLMMSGIGPAQHLHDHGIEVILDQPKVGQGMGDNPMNGLIIPSPRPIDMSLLEIAGITDDDANYIEACSGLVEFPWEHYLEGQSSYNILAKIAKKGMSLVGVPNNTQVGIILEKVAAPLSKGHLELRSTDPNDNPKVTFNYFQNPRDVKMCVKGMEIIKRVVESDAFSKFRYKMMSFHTLMGLTACIPVNVRARHFKSAYSMEQFCKDTVTSIWHYRGGCQMDSVVDHEYRVLGVDSLRVIDASTFLDSPGTNPQATYMMIGRYMGLKMIG